MRYAIALHLYDLDAAVTFYAGKTVAIEWTGGVQLDDVRERILAILSAPSKRNEANYFARAKTFELTRKHQLSGQARYIKIDVEAQLKQAQREQSDARYARIAKRQD